MNLNSEILEQAFFENSENKIEISKTIVAFSNTNGGVLFIGKNSKGKTIGILPSKVKEDLIDLFDNYFDGEIKYHINEQLEKFKFFIEITILKKKESFVSCIYPVNQTKCCYIRSEGVNIKASNIQLSVWKYKIKNVSQPKELSDDESMILNLVIQNAPISISKIFKKSTFDINKTENILVRLISWDLLTLKSNLGGSFLERL